MPAIILLLLCLLCHRYPIPCYLFGLWSFGMATAWVCRNAQPDSPRWLIWAERARCWLADEEWTV